MTAYSLARIWVGARLFLCVGRIGALVKLFIGLGVLIFAASAVAVGLALPYVVLERGFTQVIVGTVGMNAGLVLIGIGILLREIRKRLVPAVATAAAEAATGAAGAGAAATGLATAGLAAAGLATAGLATAGLATSARDDADASADRTDQLELDWPKAEATLPAIEPAIELTSEPTLAMPRFELPPLELPKLDLPKLDLPKLDLAPFDLSAVERPALAAVEADMGNGQAEKAEAAIRDNDMPGQDEFSRLRAALSDQLADHREPADEALLPEANGADEKTLQGDVESLVQAQDDDQFDNREEDQELGHAEREPILTTEDIPEAAIEDSDDDGSEADEPEAAVAPAAAPTTVSNEGVVRAYQVGDTAFTVYGDGTIQAETSEGRFTFESMDEVRAFLAQEKLKVRS
jgi:GLTT repeat (6 copies)